MATVSLGQTPSPKHFRIERRSHRRTSRKLVLNVARTAAWCLAFLTLGWLVAAGVFGLLVGA